MAYIKCTRDSGSRTSLTMLKVNGICSAKDPAGCPERKRLTFYSQRSLCCCLAGWLVFQQGCNGCSQRHRRGTTAGVANYPSTENIAELVVCSLAALFSAYSLQLNYMWKTKSIYNLLPSLIECTRKHGRRRRPRSTAAAAADAAATNCSQTRG